MKFRTISRIVYLKKARHRRGHGIHSPFLFHLITTVLENKRSQPEYKILKDLKNKALNFLSEFSDQSLSTVYHQFNLPSSNPRRLYRKVELPIRYGKVVFRLIREFKPSSVINYGPTFGANLTLLALANNDRPVFQLSDDPAFELVSKKMLNDSAITNVSFSNENSAQLIDSEFIIINSSTNHDQTRNLIQKRLSIHGDDDVLIIRGIHESKEMAVIWKELIASENVRVSLDLFEIGIALFRKGLQKENFIQRF